MKGDPAAWDKSRSRWDQAGIEHFPWLHCRSLQDIQRLMDVGYAYGSPAIGLNIEDVAQDFTSKGVSLDDVAQKLSAWTGPVHMATLPWVQNGQGWDALARCVAVLEIFPDEQTNVYPGGVYSSETTQQCISHAFIEGLQYVTLMFKTKGYTPASFGQEFAICHSLYTGDDIPPSQQGWATWNFNGTCIAPRPPSPPEPPVTPIGNQDGITAAVNRLRDLDPGGTLLVKGADGKWPSIDTLPSDMSKWKAWDKLQRTLQILKDDHDGSV